MELALIWSKAVSRTPGGTQMCAPEGPQLPAPTPPPPPPTPRCESRLFCFVCLFLPRWVLGAAHRLCLVAEVEAALQLRSAGFSLG